MGDHRITLKIQFSMHGREDKADWWLNWSDDIPQRVATWVEENKDLAMQKYWEEDAEYQVQRAREKREAAEAAEREEYFRLRAKYAG